LGCPDKPGNDDELERTPASDLFPPQQDFTPLKKSASGFNSA
jgi:hypothetical protein